MFNNPNFETRARSRDFMTKFRTQVCVSIAILLVMFYSNIGARLSRAAVSNVTYQPSTAVLANPDRGFYVQLTAHSEGEPLSLEKLRELREDHITLVLRFYYLTKFRDKELSNIQLDLISEDLATIRRAGCKCILRFAYSSRIGEPDAPMKSIMRHVDQLEPLLQANADVISVFQMGFIGAWGELHSSSNGLAEAHSIKKLATRLLGALPSNRSIQVRTPMQKRYVVDSQQPLKPFTNTAQARIGYHNDCFLANETDMGTYEKSRIQKEKQLLALESRFVPMGGETCKVSEYTSVKVARKELSRLHWTYLNLGYHPDVISSWRKNGFFNELDRRLGYRLELLHSRCSLDARANQGLSISITLRNSGWAALINPRDVFLIAVNAEEGTEFRTKLNVNPKQWLPGQPIVISFSLGIPKTMPVGGYRLFLHLPDPDEKLNNRVEYAVRLANKGLWHPNSGRHELEQLFTVSHESDEEKFQGKLWFEPIQLP